MRITTRGLIKFSEGNEDPTALINLNLDIHKILNKEELIIYKAVINGVSTRGKPKLAKAINVIINKIKIYLGE